MLCIYLPLPHCNLNFCTCQYIPGRRGALLESRSFIPVHLFCFVTASIFFRRARSARCFHLPLLWFGEERLCRLNCICYFHMLPFMQLESCSANLVAGRPACMPVCVFSFRKEVKGGWGCFPRQYTKSSVFFSFGSVLSHKVGLTAVIYLAGYPAFLQPRCQERQSPGYLREIWLCFFPSPAPIAAYLDSRAEPTQ